MVREAKGRINATSFIRESYNGSWGVDEAVGGIKYQLNFFVRHKAVSNFINIIFTETATELRGHSVARGRRLIFTP